MLFKLNLLLVVILAGCQSMYSEPIVDIEEAKAEPVVHSPASTSKPSAKKVNQEKGMVPLNLTIASIELDAKIIPVGLQEDGAMEVPEDVMEIGWYTKGAMPGENGNVVLAGHVDNYLGKGVFFDLEDVSLDDEVVISDSKNSLRYKIVKIESYPYDDGPIEEIFGFTSQKRLQLITCTGWFNPLTKNHEERLVVTAIQL
ncbi:class F sortase [Bacillus sp. ISL-37]|jgi:sortase A|uniref:class F sortase n=1 Tax=Bacillus sp. ISL-37 TaxID=2819123 RepID=UPI001BE64B9A|nr:class F sortase [Bacillus sp. ISL-37]MBT2686309.1 class F sortase [Bacillus sp. ISL-37]